MGPPHLGRFEADVVIIAMPRRKIKTEAPRRPESVLASSADRAAEDAWDVGETRRSVSMVCVRGTPPPP